MIWKVKQGAMVGFFGRDLKLLFEIPAAKNDITEWQGYEHMTGLGVNYILVYKQDGWQEMPGAVYMGIKKDFLNPVIIPRTIHGAACELEKCQKDIAGTSIGTTMAGYLACKLKCDLLHPFNAGKRNACKAACPLPDGGGGGGEPPPPGDPPPPPPYGPPLPPAPVPGSMELISLDDLKFMYNKIKNLFTNK